MIDRIFLAMLALGAILLFSGPEYELVSAASVAGVSERTPMSLHARDFANGGRIPAVHEGNSAGCAGKNRPIELSWTSVPKRARSLAVVMVDVNAHEFLHWAVYDIPTSAHAVGRVLPRGARRWTNSTGAFSYFGPCPPPGRLHHYRITLYALNVGHLKANGSPQVLSPLLAQMRGHVLARATIIGTFKR